MNETDPSKILDDMAETFRIKNRMYGNAYRVLGEVLARLYPAGLRLETADDHNRYYLTMMVVAKMIRGAQAGLTGHHDSHHDAAVYLAMLQAVSLDAAGERYVKGALINEPLEDCGDDIPF